MRAQTAERGGAVQVDAEEGVGEGAAEKPDEVLGVGLFWHVRAAPCRGHRAYRCTARLPTSMGRPGDFPGHENGFCPDVAKLSTSAAKGFKTDESPRD
ncbi:hypothetical protein GCM10010303_60130 [Streptomyces purpurascens]|nr:hypothetical protein GCM10010303_60130 [Streptomyces purpurascens]